MSDDPVKVRNLRFCGGPRTDLVNITDQEGREFLPTTAFAIHGTGELLSCDLSLLTPTTIDLEVAFSEVHFNLEQIKQIAAALGYRMIAEKDLQ